MGGSRLRPRRGRCRLSDDIHIIEHRIGRDLLRDLVAAPFGDMVKFVADLEKRRIAIGGQMHADAEHVLLDAGSQQSHLWGGNYYPGRGPEACVEYTSFINIRPAQGNPGMELADPALRARVLQLVHELIGRGEAGDATA